VLFNGVVDIEKRLHCETAKPQTVAAWFEKALEDYDQFVEKCNKEGKDGALLVIDEGTIIGARLKTAKCTVLNDRIIGICSCGDSQGKNIWFFCQTPFVGSNGIDLTGLSLLSKVILVRESKLDCLNQWSQSSVFSGINLSIELVEKVCQTSEVKRSVFYRGEWLIMPKLTNYSSFDRDTRTHIKPVNNQTIEQKEVLNVDSGNILNANNSRLDVVSDLSSTQNHQLNPNNSEEKTDELSLEFKATQLGISLEAYKLFRKFNSGDKVRDIQQRKVINCDAATLRTYLNELLNQGILTYDEETAKYFK
jgi:hypothetical protein